MSYYPEPDNHIRHKGNIVLDISNYVTKKNQNMLQLLIQLLKTFIALEAEVDKLDINKLVNVPTSLNHLKTKVDGLDVGKLKTVPILGVLVNEEVVKNKEFDSLNKKIPKATNLIHINQYRTNKKFWRK